MPEVDRGTDLEDGGDGWSRLGWKFLGHTSHYQKPVGWMVFPRTHNGKSPKRGGKRRWEPVIGFHYGGVRLAGVLFKSKEQAEFIGQMMYNQALLHYENETLLHRLDQLQIRQDELVKKVDRG
jgi:hypothetical protein